MSDPFLSVIVSPRLQLENLEVMTHEGIMVLNGDDLREINVSVLVRGQRSDMNALRAAMADPERLAAFLEVSVDFRAVNVEDVFYADGISTQYLRISPNLQSGFEHLSINPPHIEIQLDVAQRQSFPVQTVQHGDVPPGFELQHIRLRNETVTIRGARTELQQIAQVRANVDITGVHGDVEQTIQLEVFDANGENMTGRVYPNVVETTASVRVWPVRQAEIRLRGTGSPAAGFAVAGISGEITTVEVVGSAEILEEFENIRAEIDLTGASTNIIQTLNIADWLPEGVYLRQNETSEMVVTARIEPIEERTLTIPHGNIRSRGVVGLYQLVNENAPIRITVSGPRSLIEALDATEILPEFDLRRLPIGVHTVPLMVELPAQLTLVGTPPTLLVQIHEPAITENGNGEQSPAPLENDDEENLEIEENEDLGALPQTPQGEQSSP
jgi:YbbR domain-containing protein